MGGCFLKYCMARAFISLDRTIIKPPNNRTVEILRKYYLRRVNVKNVANIR